MDGASYRVKVPICGRSELTPTFGRYTVSTASSTSPSPTSRFVDCNCISIIVDCLGFCRL